MNSDAQEDRTLGRTGDSCAVAQRRKLCIVHTAGTTVRLLTGTGPDGFGGAEVQLDTIARMLTRRGWDITFVVGDYGQPEHLTTSDGIRLVTAFRQGAGLPLVRMLTHYVPGLCRAMAEADADVYLFEGAGWMLGPAAAFVRRRQRRLAFWLASRTDAVLRGPGRVRLPARDRLLYSYGLRRADLLVCQTQEQVRLLPRSLRSRTTVVRNTWPIAESVPPKQQRNPLEVLWAARGIPLKRPHMVLDVADRLPSIRFVLIGGPFPGHEALYESLEARARKMPNVELKGYVPFEHTDTEYARASILLCTSTVEGFPNTFLQAWNAGTVVVSTFDPDEVLCNHKIGFHCSDTESIADTIRTLAADPELRAEVAARARAHLQAHHAPESVIPQLDAALRRLISSG